MLGQAAIGQGLLGADLETLLDLIQCGGDLAHVTARGQHADRHDHLASGGGGDAEANLGLAVLIQGREEEGLKLLREARERLRAAGDDAGVRQALANEARYQEARGRAAAAQELLLQGEALDGAGR